MAEIAGFDDDVSFTAADVYALPEDLKERFDIALTTIGVLGWMPDLEGFFSAVSELIVPGGYWVMEESHPILFMYEPGENGGPSRLGLRCMQEIGHDISNFCSDLELAEARLSPELRYVLYVVAQEVISAWSGTPTRRAAPCFATYCAGAVVAGGIG